MMISPHEYARQQVILALKRSHATAGRMLTSLEIVEETGLEPLRVRRALDNLVQRQQVTRHRRLNISTKRIGRACEYYYAVEPHRTRHVPLLLVQT